MRVRTIVKAKAVRNRRAYTFEVLEDRSNVDDRLNDAGLFMAQRIIENRLGLRVCAPTLLRFDDVLDVRVAVSR